MNELIMTNKDRVFNSYFYFTRTTFKVETPAPSSFKHKNQETLAGSGIQFNIFTVLWAIATLFHMAHSSVFDTQVDFALLTLAAMYVVFRPSMTAFIILMVLQIFDAIYRMPYTTNHWLFTAFVNLTILHALFYLVIKQRSFHVNKGALLETFAPIVKLELIILYFFAVFHKLNSGFFSPETSCATDLLEAQNLDSVIPLTSQLLAFNAYFTIIVELIIPICLCSKRLRNFGILFGLFFHCVLSYSTYNAFYDFSSMVFALYFLFASSEFSATVLAIARGFKSKVHWLVSKFNFKKLLIVTLGFVVFLAIIFVLNQKLKGFKDVHLYVFWTAYSIFFCYCFIRFLLFRKIAPDFGTSKFQLAHWSFIILPLIVFLNGTCPYIGLKTESSYAMFSNLRTEGDVPNHFIVPASVQIFDYQKDVVEIISSTDPGLQKLASENKALVLFEFSNYIKAKRPEKVEYLLNGQRETYPSSKVREYPYVLSKLMKFRPFKTSDAQPCEH